MDIGKVGGLKALSTVKPNIPQKLEAKEKPIEEPKDTFLGTIGKEAKSMALKVGNITSSSVGGAVGLAALTAGLYAGAAGGAIFLGALGGGIGQVLAAISTKGLLSFLGTTFGTATTLAKVGITMGGISTGLGAFQIARKSADIVGKIPGMLVGGAIGLVTGTIKAIENKLGGGN